MIVLVPSPLLGPATWAPVADWLTGQGHAVRVVDLGSGPRTPTRVVSAVVAAAGDAPVVLVPHSNAGLYAPLLGSLLDVRATVYVDAALPLSDGPSVALAPSSFLAFLTGLADDSGVLPPWTSWWDDLEGLFPDEATRVAVTAEQPRLPLEYFTSRVEVPAGWRSRPAAYLAFGDTYGFEQSEAEAAGWPVRTLTGSHLHQLADPPGVGAAILDLAGLASPRPPVTVQLGLFDDSSEPAADLGFGSAVRTALDASSWVEHVPGWRHGSSKLLELLLRSVDWEQRRRRMYDEVVVEPRLTAEFPVLAEAPLPLRELAAALTAHYGVTYDRLWLNLYRDHRDSTGWHGDAASCRREHCVVPVLSLGEPRRFLLRPVDGGSSTVLRPLSGDLVVMGGRTQLDWRHSVPKETAAAGPRISVNFASSEQARA